MAERQPKDGPASLRPIPAQVPHAKEEAHSSLFIGVGGGAIVGGLGLIFIEGIAPHLLGVFLIFLGSAFVVRGVRPALFITVRPKQIIADIPEKREESFKAWTLAIIGCVALSIAGCWVYQRYGPPAQNQTMLAAIREALQTLQAPSSGSSNGNAHPSTGNTKSSTQTTQPTASAPVLKPSSQPLKPYDLTAERRDAFLKLLKPPLRSANRLRIGCIAWSERACVAAGQFLVLFSQAGWTIDENRVFRMDEAIPTEGVSIVSRPEPGGPLPPHLGRWHSLSLSELTLASAFVAMGVVESGAPDPSLTDGTTGVYFGIEPEGMKSKKDVLLAYQMSKLQAEIDAIERQPDSDPIGQSQEEADWNTEAEDWLRANVSNSTALHFRKCVGEKAKADYFRKIRITLSVEQHAQEKAIHEGPLARTQRSTR